ncbi:MAG: hypothetical protein ACOX6T_10335 [Myxococcales bacterium]
MDRRRQTGWAPALLLIAALSAGAPARAQRTAAEEQALGTCSLVSGHAQIRRGADDWDWSVAGEEVYSGDRLRTGKLGSLRVDLDSGGGLALEESSEVELKSVPLPGKSAPMTAAVLEQGTATAFLDPGTAGLFFQAGSGPRARLDPRGDKPVRIRLARDGDKLEVAVTEGEGALFASGEETALRAGQVVELAGGRAGPIDELPPAPTLTAPAFDERFFCPGLVVRLAWKPVASASRYHVQVARAPGFQSLLLSAETEVARAPFVARGPGRYYWRVAARKGAGRLSDFSPPRTLLCEAEPPRDALEEPAEDAVIKYYASSRVTFRWSAVPKAQSYRLVIARSPNLGADDALVIPTEQTTVTREGLASGEYWWGVYAEGPSSEPIFLAPRKLVLEKARVSTPTRLQQWGN